MPRTANQRVRILEPRYNNWTVVGVVGYLVLVRCNCGKTRWIKRYQLTTGHNKMCMSCMGHQRFTTHGLSHKHRLYDVWVAMRQRCNNSNYKDYRYYGARGIQVCKRWSDFAKFLQDMEPGYRSGLTIERINNDGDYEPSNCRWVTIQEQQLNKRPRSIYKHSLEEA